MTALGVLTVFIAGQATFIINPALANLAEKFPDVSYSTVLLLSTVVTGLVFPFLIISGNKVRYKTLAIHRSYNDYCRWYYTVFFRR